MAWAPVLASGLAALGAFGAAVLGCTADEGSDGSGARGSDTTSSGTSAGGRSTTGASTAGADGAATGTAGSTGTAGASTGAAGGTEGASGETTGSSVTGSATGIRDAAAADVALGDSPPTGVAVDGSSDASLRLDAPLRSDAPRPRVAPAPGASLVTVDPGARHQTFEGWGTSLCWWANHIGGWSAANRNALVDAVLDPQNGLGYNVFRYNIGGGENPAHHHMGQYKDMPGFEPSAGKFDWSADANQIAVLQRIVQKGTGIVLEAFSNSPPFWMTKSGCASGNDDGSNNLDDNSYDAFADYLTEVVRHHRDVLGIHFRTLEPLNEPNANWWKANGGQEGCHFSPSNQQAIIKAVGAKLAEKGLADTHVSASDENSIDDAYNNIGGFDATTLGYMAQINTHSYAGSRRTQLRALATSKGKRLWQSESGPLSVTLNDDTDAAIFMAGRIISDLRDLQPEAWVDWQVADPSRTWASFAVDDAGQTFAPLKRFYMHAAFSRYIRPGAAFVGIDDSDMVAAVSADGATMAIVVRNGDTSASRSFTFDLTRLPSVGSAVEVHRTSRSENLVSLTAIPIQSWSFTATIPAYSVTTFVVPLAP